MTKWKCSICYRQMQTETKPTLLERLCLDCEVSHWKKVVDIYSTGDEERLAQATKKLRAAQKKLQQTRQEVK
jgi:hypothetical protein